MRALFLPDVLRDVGLKVTVVPGWEKRGAELDYPEVILLHHDAVKGPADLPSLGALIKGRTGPNPLPGPLCQAAPGRTGRWYVVASGKANHAGVGRWRGVTRSDRTIGFEFANAGDGSEPWPEAQVEAGIIGTAAVCRHLGLPADAVAAHREWALPPGRKVDPLGLDMDDVRRRVAVLLDPQEDDMTDAERQMLAELHHQLVNPDATDTVRRMTSNMHHQIVVPGVGLQAVLAKLDAGAGSDDPKAIAAAIVAHLPRIDAQAIVDALVERLAS